MGARNTEDQGLPSLQFWHLDLPPPKRSLVDSSTRALNPMLTLMMPLGGRAIREGLIGGISGQVGSPV